MKSSLLNTDISFFERVNSVDVLLFTKHLSLMLKSGISLADAIEIQQKQTTRKVLKDMLASIHREIANGQTLYQALSQFPRVFDPFYVNLIKVAEGSGSLERNLDYLAAHLKKQREFANKVRGALLYPSIILSVAILAALGLSIFVLPKLIDLFNSLDVELPLSTQILLFFAGIMRDHGFLIIGSMIALLIILRAIILSRPVLPYWHKCLLSLPAFGPLMQKIQLAACFRNIGTMLEVGLPLSTAIDAQIGASTNYVYRNILKNMSSGIAKGTTIEDVLISSHTPFVPLVAVRMIGVGEKTGKLDETFTYLGDYFEDEIDDATKNLSTVLEPLILIGVGLVVAFIAISIIGPIYQFTGSIQRQ